ncbi:FACT complex subunit SSRP1 [Drosophila innubila]|uniref:FACT complex subunit SSRP1 n=1 Tax=Drosophila innubila TaxID=198719 RepID=UPI00148CF094|nr:FACT complex subunit SSRP1 [Drosophila innubila]
MESPISTPATKDFQVAGISRSGRVRKKSSKLLDFESPEEIEKRTKRPGRQPARYPGRGRPPNALREREPELVLAFDDIGDDEEHNNISDMEEEQDTEQEEQEQTTQAILGAALMNSDDEVDTLVQDLVEGVEAEASYSNDSRVRQSLYMREKTTKRKVIKEAKVQRKDKGKVRYTAYSLWAREVRKRDFPDLDFASAARRLSELWANVSNKEKNNWRRKAKIQATKDRRTRERNATDMVNMAQHGTAASHGMAMTLGNGQGSGTGTAAVASDATFVNRATTSRTKKLAAERRQLPDQLANTATPTTWAQSRQKQPRNSNSRLKTPAAAAGEAGKSGVMDLEQMNVKGATQPSSIEAIDAAAHLKLLGESLTVIGERLKEHNGHVALSGSLSVLLDSLLCSMGPLLCMTTQIPGLENKKQLSTNLATTLDNIAYVMPGL